MEKINNWLTLTANVGVLLGLVIVALELNQSTTVAEVEAYQSLIDQLNGINELRVVDPELAALDLKASKNLPLDVLEERRYLSYYRIAVRHADMAYLQYSKNLIDDDQLYAVVGPLRMHLLREIGKKLWSEDSNENYKLEFVRFVNLMMSEREPNSEFWEQRLD